MGWNGVVGGNREKMGTRMADRVNGAGLVAAAPAESPSQA